MGQRSGRIAAVFSVVLFLTATTLLDSTQAARTQRCYGKRATKVGTSGADTIRGTHQRQT
jgi:hypothetical protein